MTRADLEDKYFPEFIKWCAVPPDGKPSDILFWIDYSHPNSDNFWEWMVKYKADEL